LHSSPFGELESRERGEKCRFRSLVLAQKRSPLHSRVACSFAGRRSRYPAGYASFEKTGKQIMSTGCAHFKGNNEGAIGREEENGSLEVVFILQSSSSASDASGFWKGREHRALGKRF
jgi:hypothetical protein